MKTGKFVSIYQIKERENCKKYVILESYDNRKTSKTVYFLSFTKVRNIKIGRSSDKGLNINDATVSFYHASFKIWNVYNFESK